jgi:drug/metabolite transporter (DMT)-like permease
MQPPVPLLGEALTVLGVDHLGHTANPIRLTSVMLLTAGGMSLTAAALLNGGELLRPATIAGIAGDRTVWWSLGSLVLFSSVVAIPLMNSFQPKVSPATASVVYCSEPLFAAMFSVLLGAEHLTGLTVVGGGAVLVAVLTVAARNQGDPAHYPGNA